MATSARAARLKLRFCEFDISLILFPGRPFAGLIGLQDGD
jgi:hypothetical protein